MTAFFFVRKERPSISLHGFLRKNQNDTVSSCKKGWCPLFASPQAPPLAQDQNRPPGPPPSWVSNRNRTSASAAAVVTEPASPEPRLTPLHANATRERLACRSARTGRKASRRCSDVTRPPHRPCIYVSPASSAPTQPSPAHTEHAPRPARKRRRENKKVRGGKRRLGGPNDKR